VLAGTGGAAAFQQIDSRNFFVAGILPSTEYCSNDGSAGTAAGASYTTGMVAGSAGSQFVAVASTTAASATRYKVTFVTATVETDVISIEIYLAGLGWTPLSCSRLTNSMLIQNTSLYGIRLEEIDSTHAYVAFGNKGRDCYNTAFAGNGTAWSDLAGSANFKWRVRKSSYTG
jgi:hypothetical protein